MFFGMPARIINHDGVGIWGVIGFLGALRKIMAQTSPTHIAVLFDGEHANKRKDLDADYKANRIDYSEVAAEDNPYSQLSYILQALTALHIPFAETTTCEVDDLNASYTKQLRGENEIIISSFDSDFFQLINQNVSILRYRGDKSVIWDLPYFVEKYGIEPHQYADFKSLVGDKADNIKGAEKIGAKTAAALLGTFHSLEQLLANVDEVTKPSVRDSLQNSKLRLMKNYELIKLTGDEPTPISLRDMAYKGDSFSSYSPQYSSVSSEVVLIPNNLQTKSSLS